MIISLDESIANLDFSELAIVSALEAVLRLHHTGSHYVIATKSASQSILSASHSHLSRLSLTMLQRIREQATFAASIATEFRPVMTLVDCGVMRKDANGFICPLPELGSVNISETELIGEDLTDVCLLKEAARQAIVKRRLSGVDVRFRAVNGGGANTPAVFRNATTSRYQPTLCVTDSDSYFPGGARSRTANECSRIAETSDAICEHVLIPAREIENIIPRKFIDEFCTAKFADATCATHLCDSHPDIYNHADLKHGLKVGWIVKHSSNSHGFETFWARALTRAKLGELKCKDGDDCASEKDVTKRCKCPLLRGYGENIVVEVLAGLNGMSKHKAAEMAKCAPSENWFYVGERVLAWTLAPRPSNL